MRSILTAAVIAFTLSVPSLASAQWEHRGGWDHRGGEFREHRGFEGRRFEGERFEGRRFGFEGGEHGRRWWHGRWYPYGVGSCWRPTPVGYVWICD